MERFSVKKLIAIAVLVIVIFAMIMKFSGDSTVSSIENYPKIKGLNGQRLF